MKEKEEVISFYNNFAKTQGVNKRHRSIMAKLMETGLQDANRVLEIGCGTGSLTILLAKFLKKGNLVSLDISPDSIDIAKKNLASFNNVKLIAQDVINHEFDDQKFDAIVFPDVIEHIPLESHFELFKKVEQILNPFGFIFIHIPNPAYLEWCHKNKKELLQIIDQPVYTSELVKSVYPNGLYIDELRTYSIWVKDCDYQYIVLRRNGWQDFSIERESKPGLIARVKGKLKKGG